MGRRGWGDGELAVPSAGASRRLAAELLSEHDDTASSGRLLQLSMTLNMTSTL